MPCHPVHGPRLGHGSKIPITTIPTSATTDCHNFYKARRIPKSEAVGKWTRIPGAAINWTSEVRRRVLKKAGIGHEPWTPYAPAQHPGRSNGRQGLSNYAQRGKRIGSASTDFSHKGLRRRERSCLAVHPSRSIQLLRGSESVWRRYTALFMSIQDCTRSRPSGLSGLLALPENGPERFTTTYIATAIISSSSQ